MQGEDEFTFWHILVRDVAYAQIPRAQRAERHRKAAAWIERAAGDRVGDHADILAHHYLQAIELGGGGGATDEELRAGAGRYLFLAGERASQLDANRAVDLFRRSLEFSTPADPWYGELQTGLGGTLLAMGRQDEAISAFEAARTYFAGLGNDTRAAFAMTMLSYVMRHKNQMDRVRELHAEARAILEAQHPSLELNRLYAVMAGDAMLRSQYRESGEYAQKAIDLADTLERPELKVRPLQARGWSRWDAGDVAGALEDLSASVELGVARGYPGETAVGYNNYAGARWVAEGAAAGLETWTEGMAFSTRRGMDGTRLWSLGESAVALYDLGRWDEVIAVADEVDREAKTRSWSQITGFADPMHARILFYRGDLAGAAAISTDNLQAARAAGDPQLVIPALELVGLVAVAEGRVDEARMALLDVERITAETGPLVVSVAPELIRIACATRDLDLARRLLDASVARPGRTGIIFVMGRATIAEAEGRSEEALADFTDAGDRWAEYGSVPERGFALIGQGRCLIKLGRAAEADEPLRTARDLFAGLGAVRPLAEIDDLLAQTTARAG
jgi:tetratricopeptide (TPR) repeat protein